MTNEYYTVDYAIELKDGSKTSYAVEIDKNTIISRCDCQGAVSRMVLNCKLDQRCDRCSLAEHNAFAPSPYGWWNP